MVAPAFTALSPAPPQNLDVTPAGFLQLKPSPFRPNCRAEDRIFLWKGANTPPQNTIDSPVIRYLADIASRASLRDTGSYGSGIRKFHIFCDIFTIPETSRLPASFELLHSFALWAVSDPSMLNTDLNTCSKTQFEPVSVTAIRKYLAAVRAWHIAQGWPAPLTEENYDRINWSLRGLENIQGSRKRPVRPPITLAMLRAIKATLNLSQPFDACVWAICACAYWGMMRMGEATVNSRNTFNSSKHLTRKNATFDRDLDGKRYARLDLPSAKTAKPGEIQSIYLIAQSDLCPLEALENLARVVPATADDPLFSWRDGNGDIRPMVKTRAMERINSVLSAWGWGTAFGHSFRIGGASFYLAQKVDPEIVRLAGRWKSLAYEAYIRAFEQIASRHLSNLTHVDTPIR